MAENANAVAIQKKKNYSYAAIGLLHSLNPTTSGGVEIDVRTLGVHPAAGEEKGSGTTEEAIGGTVGPTVSASGVRKGFGRIVRDAEGNVVDVQMADEADEEEEEEEATPAVETADGIDWEETGRASEWVRVLAVENASAGGSDVSRVDGAGNYGKSAVVKGAFLVATAPVRQWP
jgi:nucleolar protein 16